MNSKKNLEKKQQGLDDVAMTSGASVLCFLLGISTYFLYEDKNLNQWALLFVFIILLVATVIVRTNFLLGMLVSAFGFMIVSLIVKVHYYAEILTAVWLALFSLVWFVITLIRSRRKIKEPDTPDKEKTK